MNKINLLRLARFDKPIGILLSVANNVCSLVGTNGFPDANILVAFIFGVVVMGSAGYVINDLADAAALINILKEQEKTSGN